MTGRSHTHRVAAERNANPAPASQNAGAEPVPETSRSTPPVARVGIGGVQASIWANHGDKGDFHTVTFDRRYQDKDGEWKSSGNYGLMDLLALQKTADLAADRILELQRSRGQSR